MSRQETIERNAIEAVVQGHHDDPFSFLGLQQAPRGGLVIRAFLPAARRVALVEAATGAELVELECRHDEGFFEGRLPEREDRFRYWLRVDWQGTERDLEDPYRFPPMLSDYDIWLLGEGTHRRPFEQLGAHPMSTEDGVHGVRFAVWAPMAKRVSVVGDFNCWDERRHPMRLRRECGVWELFIPELAAGVRYKYDILGADGHRQPQKADPYGFAAEYRPATASIVAELPPAMPPLSGKRAEANGLSAPLSIYEVHPASWQLPDDPERTYLQWTELAARLIPYVRDMGFTHIEFMPVMEYPYDGSWGYQPVGLYAPSARFGPPQGFREFVKACHEEGIGVLLDWVPGHFPSDAHGLGTFDGSHLYEHADPRQGFHRDWNTLIFNYGRNEVRNYLVGNALYWLERYGIDGLRVDAVASMLYLDYSREDGDWVPNREGGRENLEAIDFLQSLNRIVGTERPGAIMVAEESTAWPQVTQPPDVGGLGFHYKWNMGWMNDSLQYMGYDPLYRKHHHNELTHSTIYAFDENFVLPLSHDEVVHGKGSILDRMPGDDWQRFANVRAYYGLMYAHPGKKLLFMGNEFGQLAEWDYESGLDWHLLEQPLNAGVQGLVRELNELYRLEPALHGGDCQPSGFEWIDHQDAAQSVISFLRRSPADGSMILVVCNMTPVVHYDYRIGAPVAGRYHERLNTDAARFGGSGVHNPETLATASESCHGRPQSLALTLPPLATLFLEPETD